MAISIDLAIGSVATSGGGGTVGTGFLQITGGVLDTTLRNVTDNSATPVVSPLQLSTTQVAMLGDTFFGASSATTNILTLQSTTRNQIKVTNGSTFEIWRSAGVESARFDSNGNFVLGTTAASARLHVRAAAASLAGRFEDSAGVRILEIGNGGYNIILGNNNDRLTSSSNSGYFDFNTNANGFDFNKQNAYTGSGTVGAIRTFYTINNHAGTVNGIFLNATETSLTGTTHNLMDLQGGDTGGLSVFRVSKNRVSSARFETILHLGSGSDTSTHYIFAGEGTSTGIVLDRSNQAISWRNGNNFFGKDSGGNNNYILYGDSYAGTMTGYFKHGIGVGVFGVSARLHVRGDGTNPIALYQNGAGTTLYSVNNLGVHFISQDGGQSALLGGGGTSLWYLGTSAYNYGSFPQFLTGSSAGFKFGDNITYNDGNSFVWINRLFNNQLDGFGQNQSYKFQNITYTINNPLTSSGTATGIFLNATETALNGMAHNLMDLQVGGSSRLKVSGYGTINNVFSSFGSDNAGSYGAVGSNYYLDSANILRRRFSDSGGFIKWGANGGIDIRGFSSAAADTAITSTSILSISSAGTIAWGTTNAFPAIKRNSAALDFRLADDTGYCDVTANQFVSYYGAASGFSIHSSVAQALTGFTIQSFNTTLGGKILTLYSTSVFEADATADGGVTLRGSGDTHTAEASALFAMKSIKKGFLPPRMDDTAVRAIVTPAEGLVVFNTTISHFCVYQGGNWVRMSHSPM